MFGMGFTEILLIAVIAILFLGPEKLPSTMIEIAKFFRNVKNTVGSVKDSIEDELHVSDIKKEALAYKKELLNASEKVSEVANMPSQATASLNVYADHLFKDDVDEMPHEIIKAQTPPKEKSQTEEVSFKKEKTLKKEESIDV